ncbi:substrate-binding domain-containing protein [Stomatobaculum longum]|uniref:substrate-binding domain-containing protein n=1 Tax=Stomatobaculum longum TaxID=796942 RepID=UPI002805CFE2|nr:substrate-binding domain-containing protein [Stomatobaculum longum]
MRRHIMLGAVTIAATALALLLVLQTTRQTEPQRARIAVLTRRDVVVGDAALFAGMEKAAEDSKVILNYVVVPPTATLAEEQLLAEQEIADGAGAVLLEPVSTAGSGKMAEELSQRAAVVLLGERADMEAAGHFGSVSADNYAIGVVLGKEIAELLPDGGRIALLPESDARGSIAARRQGIREALRGSAVQVQEETQGVALLVGLEDSALTAAAESAAAEEKRPLVVGVGNSNRNIYALDRGDIADMIVINEFNMGYLAVAEAKKKLSSGLREMEQLRVGDTLVARDTMFSAENQKLLFPLVR